MYVYVWLATPQKEGYFVLPTRPYQRAALARPATDPNPESHFPQTRWIAGAQTSAPTHESCETAGVIVYSSQQIFESRAHPPCDPATSCPQAPPHVAVIGPSRHLKSARILTHQRLYDECFKLKLAKCGQQQPCQAHLSEAKFRFVKMRIENVVRCHGAEPGRSRRPRPRQCEKKMKRTAVSHGSIVKADRANLH